MSVHSYPPLMLCHLCGFQKNIPTQCSQCQWTHLEKIWIWTQQIEDSLNKHFTSKNSPLKIFRFDTDSMKTKTSKKEALLSVEEADIIIGTKMVTTGFNFKNIWLVGVILVEQELQIPAYNTEESVYTNIRQLLWRGWRVGQKTEFILQSFIPDNNVIQSIAYDNYKDFFIKTLEERKLFWYPPYSEYAILEYRDEDSKKSLEFGKKLHTTLLWIIESRKLDKIELIYHKKSHKKYNNHYIKIILKWENISSLIKQIGPSILQNSQLNFISY